MTADITSLVVEVKSQGIKETSQALSGLGTSAKNAEARINSLIEATKKLNVANDLAAKTATNVADKMREQDKLLSNMAANSRITARGTQDLAAAMTLLSTSLNLMNQNITRVEASNRRNNEAMREAHALARGLSGSLGALWLTYGNIAGMAVGVTIGASLKSIITVGKDVENTLEGIRVKGNETTEAVDKMRMAIYDIGKGVYGPQEVAKAFETLILAGLKAEQAMSAISSTLNLATAGGTSIEKAASTLVSVGTAVGYVAESYNRVGDIIAKTAALSMSSVETLSEAFKSASSVASLYGLTLEDIGTSLGVLSNLGIQGSAAGTALKNMYKELNSEADKVRKTFKEIGLSQFDLKDASGNFKPLLDVVKELDVALGRLSGNDEKLAIARLSNERGLRLITEALEQYRKKTSESTNALEDFRDGVGDSYGFMAKASVQLALTAENQMKSVTNSLKVGFADAFKEIEPEVIGISRNLREAFQSDAFKDGIRQMAILFANLAEAIASNLPFIVKLVTAFVALKASFIAASIWQSATAAIVSLNAAIMGTATATASLNIAMGAIAVVIGIASAAWVAYNAASQEATKHQRDAENYSKGYIEGLNKEAENLEKVNAKLRENIGLKNVQAKVDADNSRLLQVQKDADAVTEARKNVADAQAAIDNSTFFKDDFEKNAKLFRAKKALLAVEEAQKNNAIAAYDAELRLRMAAEENARLAEQAKNAAKPEREEPTAQLGAKINKAAINDEYAAAIATQTALIKAAKKDIENFQDSLNNNYKAGAIGRLQVINDAANQEIAKYKEIAEAIQKNINSAKGKENGKAALATFQGQAEANAEAMSQAERKRAQETEVYIRQLRSDTYRDRVKQLEEEGKYVDAAALRWSTEYAPALKAIQKDYEVLGDKFPELKERLDQLNATQKAFMDSARVREYAKSFDLVAQEVENIIKGVQTASEDQGLSAMFEAATAATERYKAKLPEVYGELMRLYYAAQDSGNPLDMKKYEDAVTRQKSLAEKYKTMWTGVGKSISDSLEKAFGKGGKAAGGIVEAITKYHNTDNKSMDAKIKLYGDVTESAKGFFSENSKGYKILDGVSKAFHAAEMARTLTKMASDVAGGVASLFAQGGFAGFAAAGAFLALMASLGFSGGGGGVSSKQRQETQGTGSVLGDSSAKSDSIQKSLDIVAKNSGLGLVHSSNAEKYLKNISDNIGNLASLIVRTTGLNGDSAAGVTEGTRINSSWTTGLGPLAGVAEKIPVVGKLLSKLFGATTTLVDQGIQLASASISQIQQSGVNAQSYATVNTKKKFFGISYSNKTSDQLSSLDPSVSQQFGLLIDSMAQSIEAAAKSLGLGGDAFTKKLQSFVVDIGKISFKGMTGAEIEKTLQNVFSKLGDDMAAFAVDGITKFQKVGEGALETLTRVANDLVQVQDVFATLGKSMNVTGMAAVELSESLIGAFGSIDKLTESTKYFVDNFYTDAEKLAPIQKSLNEELTRLGLSANISTEEYKKLVMSQDLTTVAGQEMFATLLNLAPAIKSVSDATEEATKASEAEAKAAKELFGKRVSMELQIAQMDKNTERANYLISVQRQMELDSLDKSLRPLQERIYQLNDEADALEKANSIRDKSLSMQIQIATLENNTARVTELVAAQRAIEISNMDASLRPMQIRINQLNDEISATQKANTLRDKSLAMQIQIQQAEGNTAKATELIAAQRAIEISALDESLQPLQIRINQLADETAAINKANDLRDKSLSLQLQIAQMDGNEQQAAKIIAAQRAIEIANMDASLRPLQERINQLNDEAAATQRANNTASLYATALSLQGKNQEALAITRGIELSKLSATDKALQMYIYTLEDSQKAYESSRSLQIALLEQLGRKEEALALTRADALKGLSDEDKAYQQAIYDSVDSIKAATDSFAVLSKAVEAQKKVNQEAYDATVKSIEAQEESAKSAFESLKASLESSIKTAEEASKAYEDLSKALANAISSALEDTVFAMSRKMAQAQLDNILSTARTTGKLPTAEGIDGILKVLSKSSTDSFSTLEEYNKDVGITANKLNDLKVLTDSAKSVQDLQLDALNSVLETAQAAYDAQVQAFEDAKKAAKEKLDADNLALDKTLENAQMQLDILNNTYVAIQGIDKALATYNTSIIAAMNAQKAAIVPAPTSLPASAISNPSESAIQNLYKVILGRDADKAGLSYWEKMIAEGSSLQDVAGWLFKSPEYINGSHANGLDEVPFDGYRAELHKGEKVLTAKQSKGVAQAEDIKAVVDAINTLKDDNSAENRSMVSDLRWIKKLLQNVAPNGQTLQVTQTIITT